MAKSNLSLTSQPDQEWCDSVRRAVMTQLSADAVGAIIAKQVERAKAGDPVSARFVLDLVGSVARTMPAPEPPAEPPPSGRARNITAADLTPEQRMRVYLQHNGPAKVSTIADSLGIPEATIADCATRSSAFRFRNGLVSLSS